MSGPVRIRRAARDEEGGNWELSFADMMTLVLCFFILVVAVSEVDRAQYDQVADSLGEAMGAKAPEKAKPDIPSEWRQKLKKLEDVRRDMQARVRTSPDALSLEMRPDAVAVNLHGQVFFGLGSAELTATARDILDDLAPSILNLPYRVTVEGHTDDIPITSAQFPSNWELSASRASAVARFLIERGFPASQVQVKGLADTHPLHPNRDVYGNPIPANQAKNRRIVILVEPVREGFGKK